MEIKKTTKADLNKRTLTFLQIGLILVLLLSYLMVEWKSYEKVEAQIENSSANYIEEEAIPITILPTPPPPVIPKAPDVIKLIEDDIVDKEDLIKSSEITNDPIADIKDIVETPKDKAIETVPFVFIEDVPVFPGCENLNNNEERKSCMSEKITNYINKEFNSELGNQLGLTGINRINVIFKIDTQGNVIDAQSRAPHPKLEQEALRVIKSLPKMQPGKQRGKPVIVSYSLPIIFKVQN